MRTAVRAIVSSLILAVLVASTPAALQAQAVDVTGTWQGTYSFVDSCGGGSNQFGGSVAGYFTQSSGQVSGSLLLGNFMFSDDDCTPIASLSFPTSIVGSVSGSTFAGTVTGLNTHSFTATVSGNSMTISVSGMQSSGTITLTRTSTAPPSTALTGSLSGSYNATDKSDECPNAITYSGGLTGTVSQTGPILTASMQAAGVKIAVPDATGNCKAMDVGTIPFILFAEVNGSSVTGSLIAIGFLTFSGTISGNTISGSAQSVAGDLGIQSTVSLSFTIQPSNPVPGTANVVVSALPTGMLQPAGLAGATDSFSVTNLGDASTNITLTQTGTFFTVSPTTFTLQPGQTQVVTIVAKAQPSGPFNDTITISGSGVPAGTSVAVRLLSAAPPTGAVNASPTVARVESVAPPEASPTGSVEFTNTGNDTLQGIVVADVPWIIPQNATVTIPAGGKATVTFTIDRSKRPDAGSLIGSATGTLSLVFLSGSGGLAAKPMPLGSTGSKTVSVSVLDTVKTAVTNGTPSALGAGELALFASGMRSSDRIVSDLMLVNRRSATVSDLKVYATVSATSFSKLLNVPSLTGDVPSAFAAIAKNIFDINGPPAAVQMRSAQTASVAVSPVQVSTPGGRTSYATALPVLRSDAGASAGDKLFLPGVEKSSSVQTALDLQELTGNTTTVQTEFLRADGSVVSSRSDSLSSFGFLEIADAVPAGATSIRITNNGAGSRVAAYARVSDSSTGDSWTVIDPKAEFAAASGDLIIPIFPAVTSSTGRFVDVMVPGSAAASVRVQTIGGSSRRRAVRGRGTGGSSFGNVSEATADRTVNVGPQQTTRLTVDAIAAGYVRLSAGSPLVASGRIVMSSGTGGAFGTALPAVPISAAIGINQTHRFTGIDDAGAATVAAGTPGTYRASLMLIETAGQSAKVRVTLKYSLPGGTRTTGTATGQRELSVASSQHLVISDLAATVIGSQRASFGDLRNMQVDVDVIEGGGRVIPAAAMVDNSTGDLMVRVD